MGAADPYENETDGESASMLDLGLPCCDNGRIDRRFNQEPDDEMDSLEPSTTGIPV